MLRQIEWGVQSETQRKEFLPLTTLFFVMLVSVK